jgi:hypothetical protein
MCAVAITFDVHSARLEQERADVESRRETGRRLDQLLWKVDTALEIGAAARLDLGNLLTRLRAQVKQSADSSAASSKTQTQAATVAVTKALDTTTRAIQAVGDAPNKTPEETPAPAADRPVTVNVPPPTVISPPAAAPRVQVQERPPERRRRWYTFLWPGNWRR